LGPVPGVISLIVAACVVFGWIVPLVVGIVRLRRRSRSDTAGLVLTIVASIWGVGGLVLGVCVGAFWLLFALVGAFNEVEQFDPSQYEGPMGVIVVPYEDRASLQVMSMGEDDTILELSSDNGRFQAPVGEYWLWMFTAKKTDEDGSEWHATSFLAMADDDELSVQADGETTLEFGPPFTASILVSEDEEEDEVGLFLQFVDSRGNEYSIARADWEEATPPRFEVRSSSGELALKGQFEYG